jgi:hypothetical protein
MPAIGGASAGVAGVPLGTDGALALPVAGEALALAAGLLAGLPAIVAAGRPQHVDGEARLLRCQDVGGDIARVDELNAGEQIATG